MGIKVPNFSLNKPPFLNYILEIKCLQHPYKSQILLMTEILVSIKVFPTQYCVISQFQHLVLVG